LAKVALHFITENSQINILEETSCANIIIETFADSLPYHFISILISPTFSTFNFRKSFFFFKGSLRLFSTNYSQLILGKLESFEAGERTEEFETR
jgi:hypothetical protein